MLYIYIYISYSAPTAGVQIDFSPPEKPWSLGFRSSRWRRRRVPDEPWWIAPAPRPCPLHRSRSSFSVDFPLRYCFPSACLMSYRSFFCWNHESEVVSCFSSLFGAISLFRHLPCGWSRFPGPILVGRAAWSARVSGIDVISLWG